jgi:hypothetical protein
MSGFLDSAEIELPCENCGRKTKKTIGWVKSNRGFTCGCGTRINIDASKFKGEIAKVEHSFGDIQRTLRNLGK